MITEYGMSPYIGDGLAPWDARVGEPEIDPCEYTQAVYYLRNTLIHSTIQIPSGSSWLSGIGFQNSLYWNHPNNGETGFYDDDDTPGDGSPRKVKYVAQIIYAPWQKLNLDLSTIWIPFQTIYNETPDDDYQAWCGWVKNEKYRAALWRYDQRRQYYKPVSATRSIQIPGDFSVNNGYEHKLY